MDPISRFVLLLKARVPTAFERGPVVHAAMYIRKQLKRKGTIVRGTCLTEHAEHLDYYWVEDELGNVHDISFAVAKLNNPTIATLKYTLTKDAVSANKDESSETMYELYVTKPHEFWKSIPRF
jgi:hypothetical protein